MIFFRLSILIGLSLFALLLVGCAPAPSASPQNGFTSETTDPDTGVLIRTHIESDEIGVADRMLITVQIEWDHEHTIVFDEPEWPNNGWTLIDTDINPVTTTEMGFLLESRFLIEPFLGGAYQTPLFVVEVSTNSSDATHTLVSIDLPVRVGSVLDAENPGVLDPLLGFTEPIDSQNAEPSTSLFLLSILIGVGVFSVLVIWMLTRRQTIQRTPTIYELFEHVANAQDQSTSDAYSMLYQSLIRLDPRLQQTSEIRTMIEQCEHARFSMSTTSELDPVLMARHTLELLGHSESGQA